MDEDVEPCDVHRAERRALRPAECGAGDGVDLLDRVRPRFERAQHLDDAVDADVIGDEVRRVFRDHDAFAEPAIREPRHELDGRGIGVGRWNQLEEMQVARRIEEVCAEKVAPKVVASPFGERRDRNAARVRRHDRARPADAVDALEQRPLHVGALQNGLHDPVDGRELLKVGVEAAGRDERGVVRGEKRIRLQRTRALQPLACDVGCQVEEQHGHARVREVRGNLRAHRARAEHGGRSEAHRARAPLMKRSTTASASDSSE